MFERIYNLLVSFLGESKRGYDRDVYQYQFNCPSCANEKGVTADGKYNLEINLRLGKYNCWVCCETHGTRGNISNLIRKYGNGAILREYFEEINNIRQSKLYDINLFKDEILEVKEEYVTLPETFKHIDINKCRNKKLLAYLNERHITQDLIDRYKIGYTTFDEKDYALRNRIIIPSYDMGGSLNFWTGRDFTKNPKVVKYYNVKADKKQIIFNESNISWDGDIYLCEGPFDMLSCPYNVIPLLGKSLKKDSLLFQTLYKKANSKIIIYLDGDAKENVKLIYKTLNVGRLRNKIWYVPINEDLDPSDLYCKYGKAGVIKLLRKIEQYSEIDLLS